ncbi:hypothetical protein [Hymenobacter sp. PAMC 26628]|uniref:hypothetical protein n=1 Tax=Hymenobacter sp. PAMC 26628 TaxID=1484118 RepID=UPI0007700375|nr:hypothetical protein [Hymenobacter sp. PAMC 26628]AMJ65249.1 hypothetical protein AXW84_07280 [Hymenobacter sp. PAMC 26628]
MTQFAQFNGTIGPANLLGQVRNTAPFLFDPAFGFPGPRARGRLIDLGGHPYGWLDILRAADALPATPAPTAEELEDYFALCLAAHHATVATFVPTDVDGKIRGGLWQERLPAASRRRMFALVRHAQTWDLARISTRTTALAGVGPVSGHDGELLGVLAGALGAFVRHDDAEYARLAAETIDAELRREVHEFDFARQRPGQEIDVLKLAMSLTHNCGDTDQGLASWAPGPAYEPYRARFGRLAHDNAAPYGGAFQVAARLYKNLLAAEGHRHYPLREVRCLRRSPDFLLPLGPFLDAWGALIATHPALAPEERAEVLAALLAGCKKIRGQVGYYRAVSGFAHGAGGLEKFAPLLPAAARQELKDPEVKRQVGVSRASFEAGMRKRARQVLAGG